MVNSYLYTMSCQCYLLYLDTKYTHSHANSLTNKPPLACRNTLLLCTKNLLRMIELETQIYQWLESWQVLHCNSRTGCHLWNKLKLLKFFRKYFLAQVECLVLWMKNTQWPMHEWMWMKLLIPEKWRTNNVEKQDIVKILNLYIILLCTHIMLKMKVIYLKFLWKVFYAHNPSSQLIADPYLKPFC